VKTSLVVLLSSLVLMLCACVPVATSATPNYTFEPLPAETARAMIAGFTATIRTLELRVETNTEVGSRYVGSDGNAFLFIVDRFYRENPGFCPLERGGFGVDAGGKTFLTLAAKGLEVRGFVYDLSSRPSVSFVVFRASSAVALKTQPCRTVSGS
jgi:hypothetical protein